MTFWVHQELAIIALDLDLAHHNSVLDFGNIRKTRAFLFHHQLLFSSSLNLHCLIHNTLKLLSVLNRIILVLHLDVLKEFLLSLGKLARLCYKFEAVVLLTLSKWPDFGLAVVANDLKLRATGVNVLLHVLFGVEATTVVRTRLSDLHALLQVDQGLIVGLDSGTAGVRTLELQGLELLD